MSYLCLFCRGKDEIVEEEQEISDDTQELGEKDNSREGILTKYHKGKRNLFPLKIRANLENSNH